MLLTNLYRNILPFYDTCRRTHIGVWFIRKRRRKTRQIKFNFIMSRQRRHYKQQIVWLVQCRMRGKSIRNKMRCVYNSFRSFSAAVRTKFNFHFLWQNCALPPSDNIPRGLAYDDSGMCCMWTQTWEVFQIWLKVFHGIFFFLILLNYLLYLNYCA